MTPTPRKDIKLLFAQIMKLPPNYVVWKGENEPGCLKPDAGLRWALMRIGVSAREAVGSDNVRRNDNNNGTYTMMVQGRRRLTLSVDLFTFDPQLEYTADDLLEDLRGKPWHPDNLLRLNNIGLVYEDAGPITPLPTRINGREVSAAHLDVYLAMSNIDAGVDPYSGNWIEEVTGTGTLDGGSPIVTYDVKKP